MVVIATRAKIERLQKWNEDRLAENERLRAGFTRHLQDNNDCPITGVFCRPGCGCDLEMQDWVRWTTKEVTP